MRGIAAAATLLQPDNSYLAFGLAFRRAVYPSTAQQLDLLKC